MSTIASISCPLCDAAVRRPCVTRGGRAVVGVHMARIKALSRRRQSAKRQPELFEAAR